VTSHAFVDESSRGNRYLLCAVTVDNNRLSEVRRLARGLCVPGQRRWHFVSESGRRRKFILDSLVRSDAIRALVYVGTGAPVSVRRECLTTLVYDLLDRKASRLLIESQQGQDPRDQRCIIGALQKAGGELDYAHLWPHQEPGLWLPDAVAWAYGAGDQWRRRVEPMIELVRDVGRTR
jgi:hypothetical protein